MAQVSHLRRARWTITALACAAAFLSVLLSAQRPDQTALAQRVALSAPVPADPDLITRTLPNGVRTYVRRNAQPAGRVELRLVVRAGSVLEEESERGLAHFIEHMAFHGTTSMRPGTLRSILASIGMTSTADANASTNYDQTVYQMRLPVAGISTAIRILAEWSHDIAFNPADVESERRIVLEEIRQRESATRRMFPILLKGTRYADRSPSGLPAVVQRATVDDLRGFYEKWYRPDLTGVIAVGDFYAPDIDDRIRRIFEPVAARPSSSPRPTFVVPDHAGTIYAVATDPEMTATRVELHHLLPQRDLTTVDGYRQKILDSLFRGMVSTRFAEAARAPDAPFVAAAATRGPYLVTRGREDASLAATVRDYRVEASLGALLDEAKRLERFGFGVNELNRQKQAQLRSYERNLADQATRDSANRAAEYIRNFLDDETLPTIELEYALWQRFLPEITVADVNRLVADWSGSDNRIVLVTAPSNAGTPVIDEARLAAAARAAAAREPSRYDDGGAELTTLIEGDLRPGQIVTETAKPELGLTEWTLSNGVTVVLKPSQARADEVAVRAVRLGGASVASDADYASAIAAPRIVGAGGVGRFNLVALQRALVGKVASVNLGVSEFDESLSGSASPKDLETLFQLIHLRMTAPRADADAFRTLRDQTKSALAGARANPDYQFQTAIQRILDRDSSRRRLAGDDVDRWDLDRALAFYKRRFGNADGFTFVFVGNVEPAAVRPLVVRYLASLPAAGRSERWKDDGVRPPGGVVTRSVRGGVEARSRVSLIFNSAFDGGEANRATLAALSGILGSRLNSTMRERLGGTYGVTVSGTSARVPVRTATVTITWTCDPARVDELVDVALSAVKALTSTSLPPQLVSGQADLMARLLDQSNRVNSTVAGQIALKYEYGEDVVELAALPDIYKRLDASAIQRAAQQYLNPGQYLQVVMVPETARR